MVVFFLTQVVYKRCVQWKSLRFSA